VQKGKYHLNKYISSQWRLGLGDNTTCNTFIHKMENQTKSWAPVTTCTKIYLFSNKLPVHHRASVALMKEKIKPLQAHWIFHWTFAWTSKYSTTVLLLKLWTSVLLTWFAMITKCWYLKETFLKKCACVSLCELDWLHLLTRHLAKMTWHSLSHSRSICTFQKCWSEFVMFSWLYIFKCNKYIKPDCSKGG